MTVDVKAMMRRDDVVDFMMIDRVVNFSLGWGGNEWTISTVVRWMSWSGLCQVQATAGNLLMDV